jgi:Domain of unknown function (DUF4439)
MRRSAARPGQRGQQAARPASAAVTALQTALAAEQAASYGYGIVGAHLGGQKFSQATTDWVAHQRARDELSRLIAARNARPHAAAVAYRLPAQVRNGADAVALAIVLEHQVTAAYLGVVALPDPALREFGARRMQAAAVAAARWGGHSQAFPGLRVSALRGGQRAPASD